ncbi:hypothetical protein D3C71_1793160 [compost metagenome]
MSPITARATEIRVMQYHAQQLATVLSKLDQGLLLCGKNPEQHHVREHLVSALRVVHGHIGTLLGAQSLARSEEYLDNRGLTP